MDDAKDFPARSAVFGWLSRNPQLAVLIGLVLGVAGLAATLVLGIVPLKTRKLTFYVHPVRTTIVRSGRSSDLHVLYKGQLVSTDVTALQVAVWSTGGESIRPEHVLEPVILKTVPRVAILEAKIHYVSRPLSGVALDISHVAEGYVGMNWRILEKNDGAVFQFIVAGPATSNVMVSGALEDQPSILPTDSDAELWRRRLIYVTTAMGISLGVLALIAAFKPLWQPKFKLFVFFAVCYIVLSLGQALQPMLNRDVPATFKFDTTMMDDGQPPPRVPPGG